MTDSARIQHLRVAAVGRRGVPTVQSVVEDAFRTQLSAIPGHRLLVLRHIELGAIGTRRDQPRINQLVSRHLRQAMRHAVPFDAANVATAPAAWFPDPLAPHRAVVKAIATGTALPTTWPMRAVFGQALFADPQMVIEHVLTLVLQAPHAAPSVVRLLRDLGPALVPTLVAMPPRLVQTLFQAITTSGLPDPHHRMMPHPAPTIDMPDQSTPPPVEVWSALRRVRASFPRNLELASFAFAQRELIAAVHLATARNGPVAVSAVRSFARAMIPVESINGSSADPDTSNVTASSGPLLAEPETFADETTAAPVQANTNRHQSKPSTPDVMNLIPYRQTVATPDDVETLPDMIIAPVDLKSAGQTAPWAGLVFVLVLIDRAVGPALARPGPMFASFGQRLLHLLLSQIPLPENDPFAALIAQLDVDGQTADDPFAFQMPRELARPLIAHCNKVRICRVANQPGWRMACIRRSNGRTEPLAIWFGQASADVRTMLRSTPIHRGPSVPFCVHALLRSYAFALRLWLRQTTRLSLRQLAHRPGQIAVTETHVDVTFDASLIDLTLRRHGLDITPGWCPWLYRVVTIHYDFGEHDAG